ncbi:uncharacterized protein NEMAJ01_1681 [Nematocida major]|uniref:uncharacterized protein n=1 Tax=Nematocida major TaxID=1912982 RepID=UPI0020083BED|nr:uncharacterized protein NEMAJ01_1681 [Nematocida major]KAH9386785.1 hypothetical protein NEMAJ01_1681 [Nematocida major]
MKKTASGLAYCDNGVESEYLIVLVGGLGDTADGFYSGEMMDRGASMGVRVFSLGLRSMPNYGLHSIHDDVHDVSVMYTELGMQAYAGVWFIGHSTGCQVLMLYAQAHKPRKSEVFILQAPVSDREYEESVNPEIKSVVEAAERLIESAEETDSVFLMYKNSQIRADRIISLFKPGGDEDFFSTDQKIECFNRFNADMYCILSAFDEYAVKPVEEIARHFRKVPGMKKVCVIESDHSLTYGRERFFEALEQIVSLKKTE